MAHFDFLVGKMGVGEMAPNRLMSSYIGHWLLSLISPNCVILAIMNLDSDLSHFINNFYCELTSWKLIWRELTLWEVDLVSVDLMGVDFVGVDLVGMNCYFLVLALHFM